MPQLAADGACSDPVGLQRADPATDALHDRVLG